MSEMQYQADHIGVLPGADIEYMGPTTARCEECGQQVDLSRSITFTEQHMDGTEGSLEMTEAAARNLLAVLEIPAPPVICERHTDIGEISTERLP